MDPPRLPASLEAGALMRQAQAAGGFAMVLHKGDADGGTILVVAVDRDGLGTLYERLPDPAGPRRWVAVRQQLADARGEFDAYLDRRAKLDRDVWIVELTVADVERSILNLD
ncbi:DUF1491 family protein [Novosphingobium sp.]|uniref:DUF1491 family protein n=1 Tax=Novosphingobium sp. TaxID=1874826 RepID=UPI0033412C59